MFVIVRERTSDVVRLELEDRFHGTTTVELRIEFLDWLTINGLSYDYGVFGELSTAIRNELSIDLEFVKYDPRVPYLLIRRDEVELGRRSPIDEGDDVVVLDEHRTIALADVFAQLQAYVDDRGEFTETAP